MPRACAALVHKGRLAWVSLTSMQTFLALEPLDATAAASLHSTCPCRLSLLSTCKALRQLSLRSPRLWEEVTVRLHGRAALAHFVAWLAPRACLVRRLVLDVSVAAGSPGWDAAANQQVTGVLELLPEGSHVTLRWEGGPRKVLLGAGAASGAARAFKVASIRAESASVGMSVMPLLPACAALEELYVAGGGADWPALYNGAEVQAHGLPPQLRSLSIERPGWVTLRMLLSEDAPPLPAALRRLELRGPVLVGNGPLDAHRLSQVTSLTRLAMVGLGLRGVPWGVTALTALRSLSLELRHEKAWGTSLGRLEPLRALRELRLRGCELGCALEAGLLQKPKLQVGALQGAGPRGCCALYAAPCQP